jgi:hypothetical protein
MQARVEQKLSGRSTGGGYSSDIPLNLDLSRRTVTIRESCIGEVLIHMRPHALKQEILGLKGGENIPPL